MFENFQNLHLQILSVQLYKKTTYDLFRHEGNELVDFYFSRTISINFLKDPLHLAFRIIEP